MDFGASLAADRTNWYSKIAQRLGTRIIVSADKNPPKMVENDPLLRMDSIVMFKSPAQAWASQLAKLPEGRDINFYRASLDKYVDQWSKAYETLLNAFRPAGKLLFLCFDEFAARPAHSMEALCSALELPYDPSVLSRTVRGHAIGGNSRAMRAIRDSDYEIRIRPLPEVTLPPEHQKIIRESGMQRIFAELFERHRMLKVAGAETRPPISTSAIPAVEGDRVPRFSLSKVKPVHYNGIFGGFTKNVQNHIVALECSTQRNRLIKSDFFKSLVTQVDLDEFARIQRNYVTEAQARLPSDRLKYLDPVFWFDAKVDIVLRVNLNQERPLSILDLGTGPGHFPAVAQHFGHQVLGTDLPLRPEVSDQKEHLYDALCRLYGVTKIPLKIAPFEPLPDFGQRFDMVTGFMAAFNVMNGKEPWNVAAWEYFLKDLSDNVVRPDGRIYLQLTTGKVTDDAWNYVASRAKWADYQSKMLCIELGTSH